MPFPLPSLIEADHFEQAHGDPGFSARFPRLVEHLIWASLQEPPRTVRFPSFATGTVHGYDGYLDSDGADPYVPAGKCIFEFGTERHPRQKAKDDYDKRKASLKPSLAQETTFVFVTSRSWPGQGEDVSAWAAARAAEGHFKGVRVIDVAALVSWLRKHPVVGWLAAKEILRILPAGFHAHDIEGYPTAFERRFQTPLPRNVVLAGREDVAERIALEGLPVGETAILADLEEEAAAFACRALTQSADHKAAEARIATSIVIDDLASAKALELAEGLTIILLGSAKSFASHLSGANSVVVAHAFGRVVSNHGITLTRPDRTTFEDALRTGGIDSDVAHDWAMRSGRSLPVLLRLTGTTAEQPEWATSDYMQRPEVVAALLAGSWSAQNDHDRGILENLAGGVSYKSIESFLRPIAQNADPLVTFEPDIWATRSPVDALSRLAGGIGEEELGRFGDVLNSVFVSERDRMPDPDAVLDTSKPQGISNVLKVGLAQNLLVVSALGDYLKITPRRGTCREFAESVISNLPNLRAYPGFLAAFGSELPYLAEASPNAFLDALEPMFEGDAAPMKWLLTSIEAKYSMGPVGRFHGLIWALERLAWSSELLERVALTLARMAAADPTPDGNPGIRPLGALSEILSSWAPQTSADVDARISVLSRVFSDVPSIAFSLIEKLLPGTQHAVSSNPKPRFMEVPPRSVTYGDVWRVQDFVSSKAIELMGRNPGRIAVVIASASDMRDEVFHHAVVEIRRMTGELDDDSRAAVWNSARKELARHETFRDADWAMTPTRLDAFRAVVGDIEPTGVRREKFLFDEDMPDLGIADFDEAEQALAKRRASVVGRYLSDNDLEGLIELAAGAARSYHIVDALFALAAPISTFSALFTLALKRPELEGFAELVSAGAHRVHGEEWFTRLEDQFRAGRSSEHDFALGLSLFPITSSFLEKLKSLPPAVERKYWERSALWVSDELPPAELDVAVKEWVHAGRAVELVSSALFHRRDVLSATLVRVAQAVIEDLGRHPEQAKHLALHQYERLLTKLDSRSDVDDDTIASLEWPFVGAFSYSGRELAIHRLICTQPDAFLELIGWAYIPEGVDRDDLSEADEARASASLKVLWSIKSSPYFAQTLRSEELSRWVAEVLRLADEQGFGSIAREYVGHVLAHAPADPEDGLWPHRAIRDLIEITASSRIERGISIERFNSRGVFSDPVTFYGRHATEEREAAAQMPKWPRVRALLLRMASEDEQRVEDGKQETRRNSLDNRL